VSWVIQIRSNRKVIKFCQNDDADSGVLFLSDLFNESACYSSRFVELRAIKLFCQCCIDGILPLYLCIIQRFYVSLLSLLTLSPK